MNKVSAGAIQRCAFSGIFGGSLAWGACKVFRAQSGIKIRAAPFVVFSFLACGVVPLQYTSKHMVVSLMRLDSTLGDETRRIFQEHAPDSPFLEAVKAKALQERAELAAEDEFSLSSSSSSNTSNMMMEDTASKVFTSDENHDDGTIHDHETRLFKGERVTVEEEELTREHDWSIPIQSRGGNSSSSSSFWGEDDSTKDDKNREIRSNDEKEEQEDMWDYNAYRNRIEKYGDDDEKHNARWREKERRKTRSDNHRRDAGRTWADIRRERASRGRDS